MKQNSKHLATIATLCWPVTFFIALMPSASGQGFVNLNFEQATVRSAPANYVPSDAANPISSMSALPGWTVKEDGTVCTAVWGSPIALDETSVALVSGSFAPIQGNYSVQLTSYADAPSGFFRSSSISQTGSVPAGTRSIQFLMTSPSQAGSVPPDPVITLNGTPISLAEISQAGGVFTLAGDVSAFAGTTANLNILCQGTPGGAFPANENYFNLDNIVFSPNAVPEPSTWALLISGASLLGIVTKRRKR